MIYLIKYVLAGSTKVKETFIPSEHMQMIFEYLANNKHAVHSVYVVFNKKSVFQIFPFVLRDKNDTPSYNN